MNAGVMRKGKRARAVILSGMALILTALILSTEGCATMKKGDEDYINYISFSPDGRKIIFDRRKGEMLQMIHVYDLETGELSAYKAPPDEVWGIARYSDDGRKIVFGTMPFHDGKYDPENTQIAVMDPDGRNIRKITSDRKFKVDPSFSHSGRKVIFCKADKMRTERGARTPAVDYDVFEVDLETLRETRLTWFKFFQTGPPYYFPDDKTFIFSAEYPSAFPGYPGDYATIRKMRDAHSARYKDNNIYAMRGGEKTLKPYIEFYSYSSKPLLSADGSRFFFCARGEPETRGGWEQIYLYSQDGKHRRITWVKAAYVWSVAASHDGEFVAMVYGGWKIRNIVIYRVKDGTSREITLPDRPSRIINQAE